MSLIHLISDGGPSVVRTFAICLVAFILNKIVIIDARGNSLDKYVTSNENLLSTILWSVILFVCKGVLVQKKSTAIHLNEKFICKSLYFPNTFNPKNSFINKKITNKIHISFVGYLYEKKGVYDLVEGCNIASENGVQIVLDLIGEEENNFTSYLNNIQLNKNITINRYGKQHNNTVLKILSHSHLFIFPSYHPTEGHPNVLNEAINCNLIIMTTKVGSVIEFLDNESCYFIDIKSPEQIASLIQKIYLNPSEAQKKARMAFFNCKKSFSQNLIYTKLINLYTMLTTCVE